MGTIKDDSVLSKIRALSERRVCAVMCCGQAPEAPVHNGSAAGETEPHTFIDPADEPIFVFRAQDMTAVQAVQYWMNHLNPNLSAKKREEAAQWCSKALAWPMKKLAD